MDFETYVSWIANPVQIGFLDLILGADNAVIIALVCRTLPRRQRLNVMIVGTGAAILLRLFLTAVAGALISVPMLRLLGGLMLVLIAVGLAGEEESAATAASDDDGPADFVDKQAATEAFWDAILLIALADGVMSLDNAVALAAIAKGDLIYLVVGLALSVPMLIFGSWLLTELFGTTPWFMRAAMAVLGWVAGEMIISDPLLAGWIRSDAPALAYAGPLASVVFVLAQGAFYRRRLALEPAFIRNAQPPELTPTLAGAPANEANPVGDEALRPAHKPSPPADAPANPAPAEAEIEQQPILSPAISPIAPSEPVVEANTGHHQIPEPEAEVAPPPAATESRSLATAIVPVPLIAEDEAPQGTKEDRLMMIGLIILFGVAAVLISGAIVLGGATF